MDGIYYRNKRIYFLAGWTYDIQAGRACNLIKVQPVSACKVPGPTESLFQKGRLSTYLELHLFNNVDSHEMATRFLDLLIFCLNVFLITLFRYVLLMPIVPDRHICFKDIWFPLQWRHNGRNSVSNHQPYDCLFNRLFKRRSKKSSKLRVTGLCVRWIHRWPVNSPHKWPVTRKMFLFDDVIMPLLFSSRWMLTSAHFPVFNCSSPGSTYVNIRSAVSFREIPSAILNYITVKWGNFGRWGNFGQYKTFILSNIFCHPKKNLVVNMEVNGYLQSVICSKGVS